MTVENELSVEVRDKRVEAQLGTYGFYSAKGRIHTQRLNHEATFTLRTRLMRLKPLICIFLKVQD